MTQEHISTDQPLEQLTEAMLHNMWRTCSCEQGGQNLTSCRPPSSRLVRQLLELVRTAEAGNVVELKPLIRRLMLDQEFHDEPGTSTHPSEVHAHFEHNLNVMIQVLGDVQQIACRRGEWTASGRPASVPMVG